MSKKKLIRVNDLPYHVTARCNNKEPFQSSLSETWNIFLNEINEITERYGCKIHAFVLMPNHFHLLITTPREDLGIIMQSFILRITKRINSNTGRSGRVFGNRYHWSLIDNDQYYDCALKYIYRNPVKLNLSQTVQTYRFSTLLLVLEEHFTKFKIQPPIGHDHNIPGRDHDKFIKWLNQPFLNEQVAAIKGGFRKKFFSPTRTMWKKNSNILKGFR